MKFRHRNGVSGRRTLLFILLTVFLLLLIGSVAYVRKSYVDNLRPVSDSKDTHVVTIEPGSTPGAIADLLLAKGVIRSDWAFEWYIRNHELRDDLKAGTYFLYQNQSISEIVDVLVKGRVATDVVTIFPAKRLEEVREQLIKDGFAQAEVEAALDPALYADHPALTDKPKDASLEGYLYPESFQKIAETKVQDIIRLSLDETQLRLTPDVRQAFSKNGLALHQAMTLASVVEKEVGNPADRAVVAQVFYKRLKEGMRLESNATDAYAKINPAYDTYRIDGLPPGPISNISESSLQAVAFPAETDWLYFVSGDDGRTHFSKTLEEHQELTRKYCTKQCGG